MPTDDERRTAQSTISTCRCRCVYHVPCIEGQKSCCAAGAGCCARWAEHVNSHQCLCHSIIIILFLYSINHHIRRAERSKHHILANPFLHASHRATWPSIGCAVAGRCHRPAGTRAAGAAESPSRLHAPLPACCGSLHLGARTRDEVHQDQPFEFVCRKVMAIIDKWE